MHQVDEEQETAKKAPYLQVLMSVSLLLLQVLQIHQIQLPRQDQLLHTSRRHPIHRDILHRYCDIGTGRERGKGREKGALSKQHWIGIHIFPDIRHAFCMDLQLQFFKMGCHCRGHSSETVSNESPSILGRIQV